ncbi:MAG: hypothetical protein HOO93_19200 [Methyloglobulus sp.]|nr:hypothetical protein [Methyloglobulus sp.]
MKFCILLGGGGIDAGYTLPLNVDDIHSRHLYDPEISRQIYAIYYPHSQKKVEIKALLTSLTHA